ncbi:MAG: PQQ-binding-like beta-propeller repeat protein, partial [Candidatus Bipolaricaulota bacterium]
MTVHSIRDCYSLSVSWVLAVSLGIAAANAAWADDGWPQWGGPGRDFKVNSDGVAKRWPDDGPKKLWTRELGDGYSAIASDGDRLYTMYWLPDVPVPSAKHVRDRIDGRSERPDTEEADGAESAEMIRRRGQEVVAALDASTGATIWEYKYRADWGEDMDVRFGPGPNSTPLIVGNRIYTIGATVKLQCLDRETGERLWVHDLVEEYGAWTMMYGYGASPVGYKDMIILPLGGRGQGVIAFR